jgi:hypothetical protein
LLHKKRLKIKNDKILISPNHLRYFYKQELILRTKAKEPDSTGSAGIQKSRAYRYYLGGVIYNYSD